MSSSRIREPQRSTYDVEATAAGIYGILISAAVMASAHAPSAALLVVTVLVTLTLYWAAERYSRIMAERVHHHRPGRRMIRQQLTGGWEMVTTSFIPLAVLVSTRLLGASLRTAVIWALVTSTVLLCVVGWQIGRHGRLTPFERFFSSAIAGVFGLGLILLKALVH